VVAFGGTGLESFSPRGGDWKCGLEQCDPNLEIVCIDEGVSAYPTMTPTASPTFPPITHIPNIYVVTDKKRIVSINYAEMRFDSVVEDDGHIR